MSEQTSELDGLRAEIAAARADVHDAIGEGAGAWGEAARVTGDEESWTVEQIASHVVENDYFFANQLAGVLEANELEAPPFDYASADEALAGLHAAAAAAAPLLSGLEADDLGREWMMEMTVTELLGAYAGHFREHAAQVRAILGALAPA